MYGHAGPTIWMSPGRSGDGTRETDMSTRPIAYTYEADYHCEACAIKRFGWVDGEVTPGAEDNEGNEVGAVFAWDDWQQEDGLRHWDTLACGDCGAELDTYCAYWGDADECAMVRERGVAGTSDEIPACSVHGEHPATVVSA